MSERKGGESGEICICICVCVVSWVYCVCLYVVLCVSVHLYVCICCVCVDRRVSRRGLDGWCVCGFDLVWFDLGVVLDWLFD